MLSGTGGRLSRAGPEPVDGFESVQLCCVQGCSGIQSYSFSIPSRMLKNGGKIIYDFFFFPPR